MNFQKMKKTSKKNANEYPTFRDDLYKILIYYNMTCFKYSTDGSKNFNNIKIGMAHAHVKQKD